jgi:hypothetical protein
LPSPSGVGVIAVTTTYFAFGRSASSLDRVELILAASSPYGREQVIVDAHQRGDLGQRLGRCHGSCDLEIGRQRHVWYPLSARVTRVD